MDAATAEIGWRDFLDAVHDGIHASCCGAGGGGTRAARRRRRPHDLATLGVEDWRATIGRERPLVPAGPATFVLPQVDIIEPAKATIRADLLVSDGRIAGIDASVDAFGDVPRIEALRHQVVVPALTDLHVHMPADNAFRLTPLFLLLHLRHGVTRVRDAGDPDGTATPAALRMIASGRLPGPDLHYTYSFVGDGPARWGNTVRLATPDGADAVVRGLRRVGASWVKAYENLDVARIAALREAADVHGLRVMGHVPTPLRVEEAGLPDAQHLFGVPEPTTLRRDHVVNRSIDWRSVDAGRIDRVVEGCLAGGIAMTPTLSTSRNFMRLERWDEERSAPDVRLLPQLYPDVIWHPEHGLPAFRGVSASDFARARDAWDRKLALVGALARAGVPLRLGTDTQQPFAVPGAAMHDEIAAFEQAGIDRETSWRWASVDAAVALSVDDAGRIRPGCRADLLVSPRSPLTSGWTPAEASATVCAGTLLTAQDLDRAIAAELARFDGALSRYVAAWLTRFALRRSARSFTG